MSGKMKVKRICVVGLGYVGLPLALRFDKFFEVIGFDINKKRIFQLKKGKDCLGEVSEKELANSKILFTYDPQKIKEADFIIVCVPTPIDEFKKPDLSLLKSASMVIGKNLKKNAIVVYESTVYPGVTEEICAPILEKYSKLRLGREFKIGYSPERINPGDKKHTIDKIVKVVSGMDRETTEIIAKVYGRAIPAGIHRAPNIKTAEAAKVIENIQRDLNIALMNELSKIFYKMGLHTKDILEAAATKWNFYKYYPGLVGGHCIGVDPYYLTYKAEELGYYPEIILAGRRINDGMHKFVVEKLIKGLNRIGKLPSKSKVLVMGLTYKENVKDARNSRIKYLIEELKEFNIEVLGCDPLLEDEIVEKNFGIKNYPFEKVDKVDVIILALPHKKFKSIGLDELKKKLNAPPSLLLDLKGLFDRKEAEKKGFVWEGL